MPRDDAIPIIPLTSCSSYEKATMRTWIEILHQRLDLLRLVRVDEHEDGLIIQAVLPRGERKNFLALPEVSTPLFSSENSAKSQRESCKEQVIRLLRASDRPLSTNALLALSSQEGISYSESTISHTLAKLKRSGEVIHEGGRLGYSAPGKRSSQEE